MLSLAYAVGLTYTFDFVYSSLYLLSSGSSWLVGRSSAACLLISTISSVWGQVRRISRCGVGDGDGQPENRRIRLTEIVERILSAREVGGFPPPMTRWLGLYAGGWTQLLREIEADRARSFGGSAAVQNLHTPKTQDEARTKLR